jgi:DNA-binding transcriptional regulator WhiA
MEDPEHPQQTITAIDNLIFFSNFDSGNLSKVVKTSTNTVNNI